MTSLVHKAVLKLSQGTLLEIGLHLITYNPGVHLIACNPGMHLITCNPGMHRITCNPGMHLITCNPGVHLITCNPGYISAVFGKRIYLLWMSVQHVNFDHSVKLLCALPFPLPYRLTLNSCYYSYQRSWHTNNGSLPLASFACSCKQRKFCLRAQL